MRRTIVEGPRHFHNQLGHYVKNRKGRLVNPRREEEFRHWTKSVHHYGAAKWRKGSSDII
jgi:hypothetical protein